MQKMNKFLFCLVTVSVLMGCTTKQPASIPTDTTVPAQEIQTQEAGKLVPEETAGKVQVKKQEIKPEQTTPEKTEPSTEGSDATEDSTKEIDDIINSLLGE